MSDTSNHPPPSPTSKVTLLTPGEAFTLSLSSESFPAGPHVEPTAPGSSTDFRAVRTPGVLWTEDAPGPSNGSSLGGPAAQHSSLIRSVRLCRVLGTVWVDRRDTDGGAHTVVMEGETCQSERKQSRQQGAGATPGQCETGQEKEHRRRRQGLVRSAQRARRPQGPGLLPGREHPEPQSLRRRGPHAPWGLAFPRSAPRAASASARDCDSLGIMMFQGLQLCLDI